MGSSNTVTATLATGSKAAPTSVVVDPVTNLVYVGNSGINTVTVIDPTGARGQQVVPITISALGPANDPCW